MSVCSWKQIKLKLPVRINVVFLESTVLKASQQRCVHVQNSHCTQLLEIGPGKNSRTSPLNAWWIQSTWIQTMKVNVHAPLAQTTTTKDTRDKYAVCLASAKFFFYTPMQRRSTTVWTSDWQGKSVVSKYEVRSFQPVSITQGALLTLVALNTSRAKRLKRLHLQPLTRHLEVQVWHERIVAEKREN